MNGEKDTVMQNIRKNKGISLRLRITLLVSLLLLLLNGVLVGYSVHSGGQYFTQATTALKVEMSAIKPSAEGTEAQTIQRWQEVPLEMQAVSTEPAALPFPHCRKPIRAFVRRFCWRFCLWMLWASC